MHHFVNWNNFTYGLSKDLQNFLSLLFITNCNVLSLNKCFSDSESIGRLQWSIMGDMFLLDLNIL